MNTAHLNLARTWRSRTFDEIVGQDLTVRLVKNSLFKGQLFPVYLLSGQRGCGKTTMGRLFAAAINCAQLSAFQQKPQEIILPCRQCSSCQAMIENNHPDFIEIDAASHTGVDNVRTIIEAASFLPLMSRYKVYLIDEAHMLSKAAFNAFLKILEEPPRSVLFLLATTEPLKIIDTVRSRCFQLFFEPLREEALAQHLARICEHEQIPFDQAGLCAIIQETEGSARDALNLIERVRLAQTSITQEHVRRVLGVIDESCLYGLLEIIAQAQHEQLIAYCHQYQFNRYAPSSVWKKMVALLSALLWLHYGFNKSSAAVDHERLQKIARQFTSEQLIAFLELWYQAELHFLKTTAQDTALEILLCKMVTFMQKGPAVPVGQKSIEKPTAPVASVAKQPEKSAAPVFQDARWQQFLQHIEQLRDPLLDSLFKQALFVDYDNQQVHIAFAKDLGFFKDLLESTQQTWQPLITKVFGTAAKLQAQFRDGLASLAPMPTRVVPKQPEISAPVKVEPKPAPKNYQQSAQYGMRSYQTTHVTKKIVEQPPADIQDSTKWQRAHSLLRIFPGTITEIKESSL